MGIQNKFLKKMILIFKEFLLEFSNGSNYKILDIYTCQQSGLTKAEIKLTSRHIIEKNINEIITDLAAKKRTLN